MALERFADLYATEQIPEYHEVVDTIIASGEEILAYHTSRRATNGPLEGINNLLQVLRRVANGFTNADNFAARGIIVMAAHHNTSYPTEWHFQPTCCVDPLNPQSNIPLTPTYEPN